MRVSLIKNEPGAWDVLFVTVPARMETPRYGKYFSTNKTPNLSVYQVLKRREPITERHESGVARMGWTPSCTEDEFQRAADKMMAGHPDGAFINAEGFLREADLTLLGRHERLGVLISGHELDVDSAGEMLSRVPQGTCALLALENESMLLGAKKLMDEYSISGLVIGTSYLSEASIMYDQLGQKKYLSMVRQLVKLAKSKGVVPFTTSSYCTFEDSGVGDKNKDFVGSAVEYIASLGGTGMITRFYSSLDLAQRVFDKLDAEKMEAKNERE